MEENGSQASLRRLAIQNCHVSHSRPTSKFAIHMPHVICTPHMCEVLLQVEASFIWMLLHDTSCYDHLVVSWVSPGPTNEAHLLKGSKPIKSPCHDHICRDQDKEAKKSPRLKQYLSRHVTKLLTSKAHLCSWPKERFTTSDVVTNTKNANGLTFKAQGPMTFFTVSSIQVTTLHVMTKLFQQRSPWLLLELSWHLVSSPISKLEQKSMPSL